MTVIQKQIPFISLWWPSYILKIFLYIKVIKKCFSGSEIMPHGYMVNFLSFNFLICERRLESECVNKLNIQVNIFLAFFLFIWILNRFRHYYNLKQKVVGEWLQFRNHIGEVYEKLMPSDFFWKLLPK